MVDVEYKNRDYPLGQGSVDPVPWPGGMPPPPGVTPPATGYADLVLPAGTTSRPVTFSPTVQWRSERGPHPLVLLVQFDSKVAASVANPYALEGQLYTQISGQQLGAAGDTAGVMRVTYGLGNALRIIEADMRAGSFQLPPVDFAQVEAFVYGLGPLAARRINFSLIPGVQLQPARFTATWRPTLAALGSLTEVVPYGARWVAMMGGDPTAVGAAGQPVLQLKQGADGIFMLHDYVNGVFISQPGQPVELGSRNSVTLSNGSAVQAAVRVKFFLEV